MLETEEQQAYDQISNPVKADNHHLTWQPSHNCSLRCSGVVKEDKVWYALHAVFRNLWRPFCVFNVQHDKIDTVLVSLPDLYSTDKR